MYNFKIDTTNPKLVTDLRIDTKKRFISTTIDRQLIEKDEIWTEEKKNRRRET